MLPHPIRLHPVWFLDVRLLGDWCPRARRPVRRMPILDNRAGHSHELFRGVYNVYLKLRVKRPKRSQDCKNYSKEDASMLGGRSVPPHFRHKLCKLGRQLTTRTQRVVSIQIAFYSLEGNTFVVD
jgi:hypothetical protein